MRTNFSNTLKTARPVALGLAIFATAGGVAAAQTTPANPGWSTFDPQYNTVTTWETAWDTGVYDRHHVLLGTVADFKPYRLLLAPINPSDPPTMVDLKNGTVIRPDGTTLVPGMRVAVLGYWSNGTFIANRVILHNS
jgi:hypothetical protein